MPNIVFLVGRAAALVAERGAAPRTLAPRTWLVPETVGARVDTLGLDRSRSGAPNIAAPHNVVYVLPPSGGQKRERAAPLEGEPFFSAPAAETVGMDAVNKKIRGLEYSTINPPPPLLGAPRAGKVVPLPGSLVGNPARTGATAHTAQLLLVASKNVRLTRDPGEALERAGALAAYSGLDGPGRYVAVTEARIAQAIGSEKNTWRRENYLRFMAVRFPLMRALPATLESVIVYTADYVIERNNKSKYVSDVVSSLRVGLKALEEWDLSSEDEAYLGKHNEWLRRSFPSVSIPPPTLSLEQLEVIYTYLESVDNLESRLCLALLKFMVAMQARATEICDGALWV
jgi:hypothetical protein